MDTSEASPPAAESAQIIKLAARRPDWSLPELHAGLQLAPLDTLWEQRERIKCPKCGRSRAHYCYDCLEALVPFPHVDLPFRVSIVTHHAEKKSMNTGVQVAVLAKGQVDLHSMDDWPKDVDPSRCAVLFPSDDALEVSQLEPDSVDRLFIIDSKWKKAGELVRHDVFRAMRAVKLSHTRSAFWRFHTRGVAEEGVCTVEALYFLLEAMAKQGRLTDPKFADPHAYDNLLWYFTYQHQLVAEASAKRQQEQAGKAGAGAGEAAAGQKVQQKGQNKGQQKQKAGKEAADGGADAGEPEPGPAGQVDAGGPDAVQEEGSPGEQAAPAAAAEPSAKKQRV
ncbi:hypothetical protein HYH03_000663 [Edaphochlamys debaryana]|uniref:tRNA-uridine aminocarboxypropyltransferase 1 n=1 Tax=Edaphochlamys debaryana TaxID=47281 RepID=A0A835YJM3_9CHLO|nr:hypothetical protein HYH03_000663 [Edaphochlamys debaryana]|eukprot:KAG2502176.1 hypothetical protein HYH03_000663 [Edaphochlamys debaryana]